MMYFDDEFRSKSIPEFPDYHVSSDGRVFNTNTGRDMVLSPTMQGELTVGMMRDGIQYRRSVKVLVAQAFVNGQTTVFDTPIQLDCDKYNLNANNIRWRPRWFAWKYSRQFSGNRPGWFFNGPVVDVINNLQYPTIFEASLVNGLLCEDVHFSILNGTLVFPTGEIYVYK